MQGQNILEFGLDISSFNQQKMQVLNEFIVLFNKLEQYDGKKISPVLGEGMTAFDKSVKSTSAALDEINKKIVVLNKNISSGASSFDSLSKSAQRAAKETAQAASAAAASQTAQMKRLGQETDEQINKLKQLKQLLKSQQTEYVNNLYSFGENDRRTKDALENVRQTQRSLTVINENMNTAQGTATRLGRSLTSAFSVIRQAAYILPGIGIAGIFDLAFQGLSELIEAMGIFSTRAERLNDIVDRQNVAYKQQFDALMKLVDAYRSLRDASSGGVDEMQLGVDLMKSQGFDVLTTNAQQIEVLEKKFDNSLQSLKQIFKGQVPSRDIITKELQDYFSKITIETQRLKQISSELGVKDLTKFAIGGSVPGVGGLGAEAIAGLTVASGTDKLRAEERRLKNSIALNQAYYDRLKEQSEIYYKSQAELAQLVAENEKETFDQRAKRYEEFVKASVAINKKLNELVLEDDISSEKEREQALISLRKQVEKQLKEERDIVLNDISKTSYEKEVAEIKYQEKREILTLETEKKLQDLRNSYAERARQADATIKTSQLEAEAQYFNKILGDTKANLTDRLNAYKEYTSKKEQIERLQLEKDLQRRSLLSNDPTVQKEREAEIAKTNQQIAQLYAGGEGEFNRIFSDYAARVLDESKDLANTLRDNGNEEYARSLEALNTSFEKKLLSYQKYRRDYERLQKSESRKQLKTEVANEEMILEGLIKTFQTKIAPKLEAAREELSLAQSRESRGVAGLGEVDRARGKVLGLEKGAREFEVTLNAQTQRVSNARRRLAEQGFVDQDTARKIERDKMMDWINFAKVVEASLVDYITEMKDQEFERDMQRLEDRKKAMEEMYDYEKNAIDKSSLSAKEKNALDIQLNAKKLENEKALQREQKKLTRDKAIFDKEIAIANITFNTAAAVMAFSAQANVAAAVAAGIAGAIQLAKAIQTKIPEYKYGTENHPGGFARIGEAGLEIVKEPNKDPYAVNKDTYTVLPKGTKVIPSHKIGTESIPIHSSLRSKTENDGWDKFVWLAKQIKPKKNQVKNQINVNINLGFENYKKSILNG